MRNTRILLVLLPPLFESVKHIPIHGANSLLESTKWAVFAYNLKIYAVFDALRYGEYTDGVLLVCQLYCNQFTETTYHYIYWEMFVLKNWNAESVHQLFFSLLLLIREIWKIFPQKIHFHLTMEWWLHSIIFSK